MKSGRGSFSQHTSFFLRCLPKIMALVWHHNKWWGQLIACIQDIPKVMALVWHRSKWAGQPLRQPVCRICYYEFGYCAWTCCCCFSEIDIWWDKRSMAENIIQNDKQPVFYKQTCLLHCENSKQARLDTDRLEPICVGTSKSSKVGTCQKVTKIDTPDFVYESAKTHVFMTWTWVTWVSIFHPWGYHLIVLWTFIFYQEKTIGSKEGFVRSITGAVVLNKSMN